MKPVVTDLAGLDPVECPCGWARRAFAGSGAPFTLHLTEISREARTHYHLRITEAYYFLECEPDAAMELDGERVPVRAGQTVLIPPGVRHRAVGAMKVIVVASPPFDPADEWED
jgi:mannose-6-phosphate isomerase-like protein (cupin superfamily)